MQLLIGNNIKRNGFNGVFYYLKVNNKQIDFFLDAKTIRNVDIFDSCVNNKCGDQMECVSEQNEIWYKCYCLKTIINCDKDCKACS